MKKYNIDMKVAILCADNSDSYTDVHNNFKFSTVMNVVADVISADCRLENLEGYDLIYADKSVIAHKNIEIIERALKNYAKNGGAVFLENDFCKVFELEFLGARNVVKVHGFPRDVEFPNVAYNQAGISELMQDYYKLAQKFTDFDRINRFDYGYAITPTSTFTILAQNESGSLYGINNFGDGYVFFANPLLPNKAYITSMNMCKKHKDEAYFNHTAASAIRLLQDEFLAFLLKEKHGFAFKRVFGTYGRPAMAWQNHLEALSAIKNKSMEIFAKMAEKSKQIPSFSLIRNAFNWFERHESIAYIKSDTYGNFKSNLNENVYCEGKHVMCENSFLTLAKEPQEKIVGVYEELQSLCRAVPCVADLSGNGLCDIICGSSDGKFYYYKGIETEPDWKLEQGIALKNSCGEEISVSANSSPILFDVEDGGRLDIISGCKDGNIYWFKNRGDLIFDEMGILLETKGISLSAPEMCDVNGDGSVDLFVGTKKGDIHRFSGERNNEKIEFNFCSKISCNFGKNTVPRAIDFNGNGVLDLAVGTHEGYIAKLINNNGKFEFGGYLTSDYKNIKGNNNLDFGQNAAPFFVDLTGNGKLDLICGRLEYGMAVPIDSRWLPHKNELRETLQFLKKRKIPIIPHVFTHKCRHINSIKEELNLHKRTFKKIGLKWKGLGTNQHTWFTNTDDNQPFLIQCESGLLWNSGFRSPKSDYHPHVAAESVLSLPFFLHNNNARTSMLLLSPCPVLECKWDELKDMAGERDVPASLFYHCDYDAFLSPDKSQEIIEKAEKYRRKFNYNFMTEPQMTKSIVTAYNFKLRIMKNKEFGAKSKFRISPIFEKMPIGWKLNKYKKSVGVKLELGERMLGKNFGVDANVCALHNGNYYFGTSGGATVAAHSNKPIQILKINLPAKIKQKTRKGKSIIKISFLEDGLMQMRIKTAGIVTNFSDNWKLQGHFNDEFTFSKLGKKQKLKIEIGNKR